MTVPLLLVTSFKKNKFFTIHHQNIEKLPIESYIVKYPKAPKVTSELFSQAFS